ncbi:MAG: NAD(P)H-hydrate dehydratase [Clostridia bacterium]|nr:NAD(P)H-hydrate dehydratase [Clostridia bacterium]
MPKRILTPTEMYLCDHAAIQSLAECGENGSRILMQRAADGVYATIRNHLKEHVGEDSRVLVICGNGNNGGDGYAVAALFLRDGISVDIGVPGELVPETMTEECRYRYNEAVSCGAVICPNDVWQTRDYTCFVDALFGIGLSKPVRADAAALIDAVNAYAMQHKTPVFAIDIPSGVDAERGAVLGTAIRAAVTVAISNYKRGHLFYPGTVYCGQTVLLPVGIADTVLDLPKPETSDTASAADPADTLKGTHPSIPMYMLTKEDLTLLPVRDPAGNKGTFGRAVIVAGCKNMCGAAYLSALAAYRSGAGLVEIVTVEENRIPLQTLLPEAVLSTYVSEGKGAVTENAVVEAVLYRALSRADAVVVGPGLGTSASALAVTRYVLMHTAVPTVIDADALNLIAKDADLTALLDRCAASVPVILTPHPGEFSRLTGMCMEELKASFLETAVEFARAHHVVLLAKDARSVVTDGDRVYLNGSGSSAMAKGGSGDVLTGILAALFAARNVTVREESGKEALPVLETAALGALIHGLAGEAAETVHGAYGVLAHETADAAADVLRGQDSTNDTAFRQ